MSPRQKVAKPAVSFGGKYRIIDFPLSNCINSGVDTVGVLTQYQPLRLNTHIGIGIPWDLDRNVGGVGHHIVQLVADPAYAQVKAELRERLLDWIWRAEGARPVITD